jgi:hypothetical protein
METQAEYMSRRAREEQDSADRASDPKIRELHSQMAGRYRQAADGRAPAKIPDAPARPGLPDEFRILE